MGLRGSLSAFRGKFRGRLSVPGRSVGAFSSHTTHWDAVVYCWLGQMESGGKVFVPTALWLAAWKPGLNTAAGSEKPGLAGALFSSVKLCLLVYSTGEQTV